MQLGPWKVLTTLPPGSSLASASNSLWIVIMRLNSFALSLILLCMKVDFDYFFFNFAKTYIIVHLSVYGRCECVINLYGILHNTKSVFIWLN